MRARPPTPIGDRPLGVIDILDGSFAALRQRPKVMISIVVVLILPSAILEGWLVRSALAGATLDEVLSDPLLYSNAANENASPFSTASIIGYVVNWITLAVAGVPVARVIGGWTMGHDATASEALRFTARRGLPIGVAFVLIHAFELIGTVLLLVPGLIALVWFSLTSPVIAMERLGGWKSMMRSAELVRGHFSHVFGVLMVVGLVSFGVEAAIGTLPSVITAVLGPDRAWPLVSVASFVAMLVLVPITTSAMALTYLDLRFRSEGLDLTLRSRRAFEAEVVDA